MTFLHRFNVEGLERFRLHLDYIRHNGIKQEGFESIICDPVLIGIVKGRIVVPDNPEEFGDRYILARFMSQILENHVEDYLYDIGLWAWLSAKYFDQICPTKRTKLHPGVDARWIPETHNYQRYYRHLIAGAFYAYNAHKDQPSRAYCILATKPGSPGDVVEQLMARQEVAASPGAIGAATLLYVDPFKQRLYPGAGGKSGGAARRFIDYLAQIDMTYDVYAIDPQRLLLDLPKEYLKYCRHFDSFVSLIEESIENRNPIVAAEISKELLVPMFFVEQALSRIKHHRE